LGLIYLYKIKFVIELIKGEKNIKKETCQTQKRIKGWNKFLGLHYWESI